MRFLQPLLSEGLYDLSIINRTQTLFQYQDCFSRHGDSHNKDKTVTRSSCLYHGDPYAHKMNPLYHWVSLLVHSRASEYIKYEYHLCNKVTHLSVWPVQNCDLIAWLEEITAKRIFTRFQLWAHKVSVKWVLGLRQSQFGSLAIASYPRSPSLDGRMRAAMGATGECHMRQCNIFDMYSFLSVTSSIVVSYTYHFTVDDDHIQKSTILSSVICL